MPAVGLASKDTEARHDHDRATIHRSRPRNPAPLRRFDGERGPRTVGRAGARRPHRAHAAAAQLRRGRGLVLAPRRGRLGARADQHRPRPRRRNLHGQSRQPRAADRRARVRARVGRHAVGSRQPGARLLAAEGHGRSRLGRPPRGRARAHGGSRHAGGGLHDRRARLLSCRRLAGPHVVHHATLRTRDDDARGRHRGGDRPQRRDRAGRRTDADHPELRRAHPRRVGHLELRAHRRADRLAQRAVRAVRCVRCRRPRSLRQLARRSDVWRGVGAARRSGWLGALQHGTLGRRSTLWLDLGR